ncbi:MAG: bacteriohemerythrin [Deltaproteobacteria bacterium]|nr:bacteriohemerythrin [Deltaproteobacteria bacterium]
MLEWKSSFLVGVDAIDSQHKELFDKVNSFLKAMGPDKRAAEFEETLKFLEDYVIKHFSDEEKLMHLHCFPHADSHMMQHKEFKNRLNDFKAAYAAKGITLPFTVEVSGYLTNWLIKHISVLDKELGAFINTKK